MRHSPTLRYPRVFGPVCALVLMWGFIACTGSIGDEDLPPDELAPGDDPVPDPDQDPDPELEPDPPLDCNVTRPGPAPLRRLTSAEYDFAVQDLLGISLTPSEGFPAEEETIGFNNNTEAFGISILLAEKYFEAAESSAQAALADPQSLIQHLQLSCADISEPCIREFILKLATRAYRRPLSDDEAARIFGLYQVGIDEFSDFRVGLELVITGVLQSPHFLYRVELGGANGDDVVALSPYELASRLSFFLWSSIPDDELHDAAADGTLSTPAGVEAQARRMLDDPRARRTLDNFVLQWLELDHLGDVPKDRSFEGWNDSRPGQMRAEASALFAHVVLEESEGTFQTLLTAPYTFANADLSSFYGYGADGTRSEDFVRVDVDPEKRAGIVTLGGVMATLAKSDQSSPIVRGVFVRERLLCQSLPSPPDDVDDNPPAIEPGATTRERFAQHTADESCAGCHSLIDPIGFGFENYDAVGRYRTEEYGIVIDATGSMTGTSEIDGDFDGAVELAHKLADSSEAQHCFVTQWFRFSHGRAETADDACTVEELNQAFADSGYDIRELLVALTQTDAFLYRPSHSSQETP